MMIRPQFPPGAWQLQADGSIPGAIADPDANNLFEGSDSLVMPGTVARITGVPPAGPGQPAYTQAYTRAVSFWGLGGNDFISGEQYDDYLDGGAGSDHVTGLGGSAGNVRHRCKRQIAIHSIAASADWTGIIGRFGPKKRPHITRQHPRALRAIHSAGPNHA